MKKLLGLFLMVFATTIFVACDEEYEVVDVQYIVHDSYACVKKTNKVTGEVVYNQAEADKLFVNVVAGAEELDIIDFKKRFAVAVVCPVTENWTEVHIDAVQLRGEVLYVLYRIDVKDPLSFSIIPSVVASISKEYADYEIAFLDVTDAK